MNQGNTTTAQYQVIGIEYLETTLEQSEVHPPKSTTWASFNNSIEASNHARALANQFDNLSFFVKDNKPPTDEEIIQEFAHLDFGVA